MAANCYTCACFVHFTRPYYAAMLHNRVRLLAWGSISVIIAQTHCFEAVAWDRQTEGQVAALLNICPWAGHNNLTSTETPTGTDVRDGTFLGGGPHRLVF